MLRLIIDNREVTQRRFVVGHQSAGHASPHGDDVQRRPQLVRDAGSELAHRRKTVRMSELLDRRNACLCLFVHAGRGRHKSLAHGVQGLRHIGELVRLRDGELAGEITGPHPSRELDDFARRPSYEPRADRKGAEGAKKDAQSGVDTHPPQRRGDVGIPGGQGGCDPDEAAELSRLRINHGNEAHHARRRR